jgi:peptidoglycan/LPS O-acetylase OafA/YrhL
MEHLVIYYLPLFVFGIVAFQWSARICAKWEVALVLLPSAALLCVRMGAPVTLVSLAAGFLIVAFPSWTNAPLAFFGTLSYSLYLLHVPTGGRVINLMQRFPQSAAVSLIGIVAATTVSIRRRLLSLSLR